jgi:hypothetical protein
MMEIQRADVAIVTAPFATATFVGDGHLTNLSAPLSDRSDYVQSSISVRPLFSRHFCLDFALAQLLTLVHSHLLYQLSYGGIEYSLAGNWGEVNERFSGR